MNESFIVKCPSCGNEHSTLEVEFLNIEEDIQGRDVFHYTCPETGIAASSWVFKEYSYGK